MTQKKKGYICDRISKYVKKYKAAVPIIKVTKKRKRIGYYQIHLRIVAPLFVVCTAILIIIYYILIVKLADNFITHGIDNFI